LMSRSYL